MELHCPARMFVILGGQLTQLGTQIYKSCTPGLNLPLGHGNGERKYSF